MKFVKAKIPYAVDFCEEFYLVKTTTSYEGEEFQYIEPVLSVKGINNYEYSSYEEYFFCNGIKCHISDGQICDEYGRVLGDIESLPEEIATSEVLKTAYLYKDSEVEEICEISQAKFEEEVILPVIIKGPHGLEESSLMDFKTYELARVAPDPEEYNEFIRHLEEQSIREYDNDDDDDYFGDDYDFDDDSDDFYYYSPSNSSSEDLNQKSVVSFKNHP